MEIKLPLIAITLLTIVPIKSLAVEPWQAGNAYPQGSEICYMDILYKARWWATPGEEPGSSQWGAWVADVATNSCAPSLVKVESLESKNTVKSTPAILAPFPHNHDDTEE